MSVAMTVPRALRPGEDNGGAGWVPAAGATLLLHGCTNTIEGVAARGGSCCVAPGARLADLVSSKGERRWKP